MIPESRGEVLWRAGLTLVLVLAVAGILWAVFTGFGRQDKTCHVVRGFVIRSNQTLPTIDYYKKHPKDLRQALGTNHDLLAALSFCKSGEDESLPKTLKRKQAEREQRHRTRKREKRRPLAHGGTAQRRVPQARIPHAPVRRPSKKQPVPPASTVPANPPAPNNPAPAPAPASPDRGVPADVLDRLCNAVDNLTGKRPCTG